MPLWAKTKEVAALADAAAHPLEDEGFQVGFVVHHEDAVGSLLFVGHCGLL